MRSDVVRILQHLGYTPEVDFRAGYVNATNVHVTWIADTAMPSEAAIDAAALPAAKALATAANRAECSRRIFERYPPGRQLSALAGLYDSANVAAMHEWIASCIAAENTAADAIEAATTVQAVEAVTVAWPV